MAGGTDVALSGLLVVEAFAAGFRISALSDQERYVRDRCDAVLAEAVRPGGQTMAAEMLMALQEGLRSRPLDAERKWSLQSAIGRQGSGLRIIAFFCAGATLLVSLAAYLFRRPHVSREALAMGIVLLVLQVVVVVAMLLQEWSTARESADAVARLLERPAMRWWNTMVVSRQQQTMQPMLLHITSVFQQHGWNASFNPGIAIGDRGDLAVDQMATRDGLTALIDHKYSSESPTREAVLNDAHRLATVTHRVGADVAFLVYAGIDVPTPVGVSSKVILTSLARLDETLWQFELRKP